MQRLCPYTLWKHCKRFPSTHDPSLVGENFCCITCAVQGHRSADKAPTRRPCLTLSDILLFTGSFTHQSHSYTWAAKSMTGNLDVPSYIHIYPASRLVVAEPRYSLPHDPASWLVAAEPRSSLLHPALRPVVAGPRYSFLHPERTREDWHREDSSHRLYLRLQVVGLSSVVVVPEGWGKNKRRLHTLKKRGEIDMWW